METHEARLASFGTTKATSKKSNSTAKGGKGPQWPHSDPAPALLAQAGFYYDPNETSVDRVKCCLCETALDGWTASDDPVREHISFSPNCGIAVHAKIEQDVEAGVPIEEDPTSEEMVNARKATFRDMWPHERKRAWTCKTQKLAEAGWYYSPTHESDDFVKCAYCGLSLDGWEPKDKPFDEHQRRSASCTFFSFQQPAKGTAAKGKKSRASKASRLSTQSTATTVEDTAVIDVTMDEGDTVLTTATDMTQASTTSKPRKAGRAKKSKSKSKAAPMLAAESAPTISVPEPEDDDFEVKVVVPPAKQTRGRKRKSDEMATEQEERVDAPAPKRRGTRTRSSTIKPEAIIETGGSTDVDVSMTEPQDASAKSPPKKGKRATRSRVTSTTRKASAMSIASKASFRATEPADEELDAALEADLNRPLTDDEAAPPLKPAKKSRATSKTQTKTAVASTVPARQEARESTMSMDTMHTAPEGVSSILNPEESVASIAPIKNPKQRATKKSKNQPETVSIETHDNNSQPGADFTVAVPLQAPLAAASVEEAPTRGKGRQPSRKASRQVSRQKAKAAAAPPAEPDSIDPAPEVASTEVTMILAPAEDEVDANEGKGKRSKKSAPAARKGKKGKTVNATEDVVEDIVEVLMDESQAEEPAVQDEEPVQPVDGRAKHPQGPTKPKKASKAAEPEPVAYPTRDDPAVSEIAHSSPAAEPVQVLEQTPEAPREASATPMKPKPLPAQQIPSPTPSPQSSDAENHPPSSRPSATRPPLAPASPVATRVPLAASTPTAARANLNPSKLATTFPWTSVDLDEALAGTPGAGQENLNLPGKLATGLTSPEKRMTVEDWIRHQAALGQERLRGECERVVQRFENEGVRALKALEGIVAEE